MEESDALKFFKPKDVKTAESSQIRDYPRRDFLKIVGVGAGVTLGGWLVKNVNAQDAPTFSLVVVDFSKCTGCRTCEAVCSQVNRKVVINGETLEGLGNPHHSNVRVQYFNPPVDIPNRCTLCKDAPCVESCPVPADDTTGRKALYRDEKTLAIKVDTERCISCGTCSRTCGEQRNGSLLLNADTGKPEGMCNLCEGAPECVKRCPFGALSHQKKDFLYGNLYAQAPQEIAEELMKLWYYHQR